MRVPRIAVAGSANIDLITYTDSFPRAGETIFGREFSLGFGGKGANQAVAARLCGAEVAMVARVGDDLFGPATLENFAARGIDTTHVRTTADVSSGVAPIFVEPSGQNRIWVVKGANDRLSAADIDAAIGTIAGADFLILQLEVPLETVYHALHFARARGIRTILNPAPGQPIDLAQVAHADYLIPNETETEALTAVTVRTVEDASVAAGRLLAAGVPRVIVTLGVNGALLASAEGMRHIPSYPVQALDTTGAGDAFIGSFACFLAEGCGEADAVARANLYAALSTLSPGTQKSFVTRSQFDAEWARQAAVT
jgi:ribokinase